MVLEVSKPRTGIFSLLRTAFSFRQFGLRPRLTLTVRYPTWRASGLRRRARPVSRSYRLDGWFNRLPIFRTPAIFFRRLLCRIIPHSLGLSGSLGFGA